MGPHTACLGMGCGGFGGALAIPILPRGALGRQCSRLLAEQELRAGFRLPPPAGASAALQVPAAAAELRRCVAEQRVAGAAPIMRRTLFLLLSALAALLAFLWRCAPAWEVVFAAPGREQHPATRTAPPCQRALLTPSPCPSLPLQRARPHHHRQRHSGRGGWEEGSGRRRQLCGCRGLGARRARLHRDRAGAA